MESRVWENQRNGHYTCSCTYVSWALSIQYSLNQSIFIMYILKWGWFELYNFYSHLTFCNPSINLSETSFITELNRSDTVHHILIPTTHRYMYHFSTGKTEIMQIRSVVQGYNLMSLTMYVQMAGFKHQTTQVIWSMLTVFC